MKKMENAIRTIDEVASCDYCIACGACRAACPPKNIEIVFDDFRGTFYPKKKDRKVCGKCSSMGCNKVCPSVTFSYEEHLGEKGVNGLGNAREIQLCRSTNLQGLHKHSSGGMIPEIARALFKSGKINGVVALGDFRDGCVPRLFSREELDLMPASIYHAVDFSAVYDVLRDVSAPVLLVGLPCQLEGIRRYIDVCEPGLEEKIYAKLGLFCGYSFSHRALECAVGLLRLTSDFRRVSYREGGKVGDMIIEFEGGKRCLPRRPTMKRLNAYLDYAASFAFGNRLKRCIICMNHLNLYSDVSLGDAWLRSLNSEQYAWSLAVSRSERGQEVMELTKSAEGIETAPSGMEDVLEAQSGDYTYGHLGLGIYRSLLDRREPLPDFGLGATIALFPFRNRALNKYLREVERFGKRQYKRMKVVEFLRFFVKSCRAVLRRWRGK